MRSLSSTIRRESKVERLLRRLLEGRRLLWLLWLLWLRLS